MHSNPACQRENSNHTRTRRAKKKKKRMKVGGERRSARRESSLVESTRARSTRAPARPPPNTRRTGIRIDRRSRRTETKSGRRRAAVGEARRRELTADAGGDGYSSIREPNASMQAEEGERGRVSYKLRVTEC
ncbi:hypothetical protein EUGRSUZ_I02419 [Eucalyptus grandis]|uniref:Uncharacterized protein n=2 Tax=Eucalyptus grandis TaxID=71139 RepID=A0ACC3JL38_EUCGR|nr:hypothetical protein EUGRSUZ_I02419 [Eucalyptus grandis]